MSEAKVPLSAISIEARMNRLVTPNKGWRRGQVGRVADFALDRDSSVHVDFDAPPYTVRLAYDPDELWIVAEEGHDYNGVPLDIIDTQEDDPELSETVVAMQKIVVVLDAWLEAYTRSMLAFQEAAEKMVADLRAKYEAPDGEGDSSVGAKR